MTWKIIPANRYPGGIEELANAIREQHTWAAIASACFSSRRGLALLTFFVPLVHQGASQRLQAAVLNRNVSYDGSEAITFVAAEARNENA